jgi:hypothetical protein
MKFNISMKLTQQNVTRLVSYEKQELLTLREHLSSHPVFSGVRVAYRFSFLCCLIMGLYVLSSVLWCPLGIPHKNDVRFVFTSSCLYNSACLIYVFCVCLCIVVSNTNCVVFLFCFSSSCVSHFASFSRLSFLIAHSVFFDVYLIINWGMYLPLTNDKRSHNVGNQ